MLRIDVPDLAKSIQPVTLDKVDFYLGFNYNTRNGKWTVDLYDEDKNLLVAGAGLQGGYVIFAQQLYNPSFPAGILSLVNTTSFLEPVGRDNVGTGKTWELVYIGEAELNEFTASA